MTNQALLTNREYQVDGDWYSPKHKLNDFLSVVKVDYIDQTSSAGDWSGYILQKLNKKYYLIGFSQENNAFAGSGFTLRTGELETEFNDMPTENEILEILSVY